MGRYRQEVSVLKNLHPLSGVSEDSETIRPTEMSNNNIKWCCGIFVF